MPLIQFDGPKMDKSRKSGLVRAVAKQASQIPDIPEDACVTILRENEIGNIANGFELLSDHLRKRGD